MSNERDELEDYTEGPTDNLSGFIDHTLLRPDATMAEIEKLCDEARTHHFKTVCVEPKWVAKAAALLKGSAVLPITVISFPKGGAPTSVKVEETRTAIGDGAREVDMVLNRDWLKKKKDHYRAVYQDISAVVEAAWLEFL